jgi:hypothetical protein
MSTRSPRRTPPASPRQPYANYSQPPSAHRAGGYKEDPDIAQLADWEVVSVKAPGKQVKILPKGDNVFNAVLLQVATGGDVAERRTAPVSVSAVGAAIARLDCTGIAQVAQRILTTLPRRDKGKERFKSAAQQRREMHTSGTARKKRMPRAFQPPSASTHTPTTLSPNPTPGKSRGADQAEIEAAIEDAIQEKNTEIIELTSELDTARAANERLTTELTAAKAAADEALEAANRQGGSRSSLAQHTRFSTTASKVVLQAVLSSAIQRGSTFRLMVKSAAAAANLNLPAELDVETLTVTDCIERIESIMFPHAEQ